MQIPDQILNPVEKRHAVFVDDNNQYDLREAREAEQASLQLSEVDQAKFGKAFIKFPKVLLPANCLQLLCAIISASA